MKKSRIILMVLVVFTLACKKQTKVVAPFQNSTTIREINSDDKPKKKEVYYDYFGTRSRAC